MKRSLIFAAALSVCLLFAGCGRAVEEEKPAPVASPADLEITQSAPAPAEEEAPAEEIPAVTLVAPEEPEEAEEIEEEEEPEQDEDDEEEEEEEEITVVKEKGRGHITFSIDDDDDDDDDDEPRLFFKKKRK